MRSLPPFTLLLFFAKENVYLFIYSVRLLLLLLCRQFDIDGNGFISPQELRSVVCTTGEKLSEEEADELIRMFDTNEDGQLSWEEFVEFVKANRPSEQEQQQ